MAEITYFVVVPFQETEGDWLPGRVSSARRKDRLLRRRAALFPRVRLAPSHLSAPGIPTSASTAKLC